MIFNTKKVDSLIAINAPNTEIYKAMGLHDDAGFVKRKLYAQGLKFYKQRNGGSILQMFYDSIPIAMFVLLPYFCLIAKTVLLQKRTICIPFGIYLLLFFFFVYGI